MILNASAENGSPSSGLRSSSSLPLTELPAMAGMSTGAGRYMLTASSSGCTPLFLKALPVSTGTICPSMVPWRTARWIVAASTSSPSR